MSDSKNSLSSYKSRIATLGGIEDVLSQSYGTTSKLHSSYINPYVVWISRFMGFGTKLVRAAGLYLYDENNNRYLDFLSGYGALNLGHEPPQVLRALEQVENTPNLIQAYMNPFAGKLAEYLSCLTEQKLTRIFFSNSGSEACEAAIKLARASTGKTLLVFTEGAFHGKTMGSLSVSGREKYKRPFAPMLSGTISVPFGDIESLEKVFAAHNPAAFIVEPIQGEAGVIVPKEGYLKAVRRLCDQYGVLLILDEIQTGMGRTGRMFCYEYEDITPDILALSKSLGGGVMPIGATLAKDNVWKRGYGSLEKCLLHTNTFGGNTRACACGIAAIRTLVEENLINNAGEMGDLLLKKLSALQKRFTVLKSVRGKGLMIGLTLARLKGNKPIMEGALALWVARQLHKRHRIITAFSLNNYDVIRIAPPLIAGREEIDYFLSALEDVLKSAEKFVQFRLVKESAKA